MAGKGKIIENWRLKKWIPIVAPAVLRNVMVGETPALEPEDVIGRTITISLLALTGDVKKQNITVTLKITHLDHGKAMTELTDYEIMSASVRRMIRKGRTRIDDSFECVTQDGVKIRIKPLLIPKTRVTSSKSTLLRKLCRQRMKELAAESTYDRIISGILSYGLQKNLGEYLSKVYPLKSLEIRMMTRIGAGPKPEPVQAEPVAEPVAAAKEEPVAEKAEEVKEEKPAEEKPKKKKKKEEKAAES